MVNERADLLSTIPELTVPEGHISQRSPDRKVPTGQAVHLSRVLVDTVPVGQTWHADRVKVREEIY